MKIDINKLSEAELIDLSRRLVERLRFLNQMRAHTQMLEFRIGDRVTFHPESHPPVTGILTRYNKKTVTVISDDRVQWNVSPGFLTSATETRDVSESRPGHRIQQLTIELAAKK